MNSINLYDFIEIYKERPIGEHNRLVNVRGTNGSGKSSIPFSFINSDPNVFELTYEVGGRPRVAATICPNYKWLFIGSYKTKCGGLDSFKSLQQTSDTLAMVWGLPFNIVLEGIIASTTFSSYAELFKTLNKDNSREVIIATLLPPVQTCIDRVQIRNGGKEVKDQLIRDKYKMMERNLVKFKDAGFDCRVLDNSEIKLEDTRNWFLKELDIEVKEVSTKGNKIAEIQPKVSSEPVSEEDNKPRGKDVLVKELARGYQGEPEELYAPDYESDIKDYEWEQYYKEPDSSVKINWDNMRFYWYWIAERMNIWYKRTILKEPQPWTEDKILQDNKFTNCIRDLDRGTIVYIKDILLKLDEPCEDLVKRKKEVMLNTMIYRLFIRKSTMNKIGFLYLDTWDEQWEIAKKNLRELKAQGETVFHGAYFVNDLKSANPDKDKSHNKVENAICLCENFHENIDKVYDFVTTNDMKACLDFLNFFPAISNFTIYEWLCDWGMAYKYVENELVDWTDDSYVNIGPGNKRGLDYIFMDRGNLDYYECNFYLRASWKHYMEKYGYLDRFLEQLPEFMGGDINMRVIEHDLCELSKYLGVHYGIGKCKGKFKNESKDCLDELVL